MLRTLLIISPVLLLPLAAQERPAQPERPVPAEESIRSELGLRFAILTSKIRRRLTTTDTPYGFAVRSVAKGSLAAENGLERGMVVLEVDGKPLYHARELAAALRAKKPGDVLVLGCERRKRPVRLFDRDPWESVVLRLRLPADRAGHGEGHGEGPGDRKRDGAKRKPPEQRRRKIY